jgi:MFS family permease
VGENRQVLRRPAPDSLWADPDWRRYWTSRIVSYAGGTVTYVAAPILVYALTGSALLTGVTAATEGLPYLLFGLVAGALADRVNRKRLMVWCDVANAAVLASVPIAAALGRLTAAQVIVTGFVVSSVFVFFDAANFGAVPTLVGKERIREANSAVWGTTQVFDVVLPGLVGVLVAVVSPSSLYWVNALTFGASALFIRAIQGSLTGERDADLPRLRDDVLTGLRWLWGHETLRAMTFVGTTVSFSVGAITRCWASARATSGSARCSPCSASVDSSGRSGSGSSPPTRPPGSVSSPPRSWPSSSCSSRGRATTG